VVLGWEISGSEKTVWAAVFHSRILKQGDNTKQVPLLYVLMSKRRKQDYIAVSKTITIITSPNFKNNA